MKSHSLLQLSRFEIIIFLYSLCQSQVVSGHEILADGCSENQQMAVAQNLLTCKPRPAMVMLPFPSQVNNDQGSSLVHLVPSYVTVDRCSGSCMGSPTPGSHICQPTQKENVTFNILVIHANPQIVGQGDTRCATVVIDRHTSCACSCKQSPGQCDLAIQFYDPSTCTCQCLNQAERALCMSGTRTHKIWDPRRCTCLCPPRSWQLCSTGYTFDFADTCSCIRTYSMVASGGLTFIVLFVILVTVSAGYTAFHLKKRGEQKEAETLRFNVSF